MSFFYGENEKIFFLAINGTKLKIATKFFFTRISNAQNNQNRLFIHHKINKDLCFLRVIKESTRNVICE